jgi:hypothetical protein
MPKGRLNSDKSIQIGGDLTGDQINAVKQSSLTPEQILSNLDGLNEEIQESWQSGNPIDSEKILTLDEAAGEPKLATEKAVSSTPTGPDDFSSILDKMQAEIKPAQPAVEEKAEEPKESAEEALNRQILELLSNAPSAPSEQQIFAWKSQHGKNGVYVTALGDGDVYVYTHLRRVQWQKLQETMQKAAQANVVQDVEEKLKEHVLTHCVLWPKPLTTEFFYNSRAGVVDSIYQAILMNSYFLNPQQVMMLTTQL